MGGFLKDAAKQTLRAAVLCTVFCLLATALFAVFVRAFSPSDSLITEINWFLRLTGVFLFSLLFVRRERALFKGMAAGILSVLLTMLIFGFIGGFHVTAWFLLELLAGAAFGGAGGLLGAKIGKE